MIAKTLQDMFKRYRRPGDFVFATLFLVFSVLLLTQLGEQTQVTKRTKWFAQPGFWPMVSLWAMTLFAFFHWLSSAMSPRISVDRYFMAWPAGRLPRCQNLLSMENVSL